jgi:hypothetical protein
VWKENFLFVECGICLKCGDTVFQNSVIVVTEHNTSFGPFPVISNRLWDVRFSHW